MDRVVCAAMALIFLALSAWTVAKGSLPLFYTEELYFWVNTYGHGLVRRGLVGTLISPLLGRGDEAAVHLLAAQLNWAGLAVAIGIVTGLLVQASAIAARIPVFVVAAILATSPFFGLVAHHTGYPDGLIAAFLLAGGLVLPAVPSWCAAGLLVAFSALHELAFLLILPFALFSSALRPGWGARQFWTLGAGVAAALSLVLFSNRPSPDMLGRLVSAGLSPTAAGQQLDLYLGHGTLGVLGVMARKWASHPLNGLLGLAYGALPGACITWLGLPFALRAIARASLSRWYRATLIGGYFAACMSGVAVLALAWDLSRIASFTSLTAFITVTLLMRTTRAETNLRAVVVGVAICICFAVLPVFNLYFESGWPVRMNMLSFVCAPCASASLDFMDVYNRDLSRDERMRTDTDPVYGNNAAARERMPRP